MKKILLSIICALAALALSAQTFVSTEPTNKNAILEEYTGVNCSACPIGHLLSNQIMKNNPGRAWAINIHQGGYAITNPDYRTDFGDALAEQTDLYGYPAGTVNRQLFPEFSMQGGTAIGHGDWQKACNQVLIQPSYVNVAAKSYLNLLTRKLSITVEVYYTDDSPVDVNKLNVALLQSRILGYQLNMDLNPEQMVDGQYSHNHMLRHLFTGQWGEDITTTTQGSFFSWTLEYDVPEDFYGIPVDDLEQLEIIAFVAEGKQEIISGIKSELYFDHIQPRMIALAEMETYSCKPEVQLVATVDNTMYDKDITSLRFEYEIDGNQEVFVYEETIPALEVREILLPVIPIISGEESDIIVRLTRFNNEELDKEIVFKTSVSKTIVEGDPDFSFKLVTDRYGSQTSFKFFDEKGSVVLSGGPYTDLNYDGTSTRRFTFSPDTGKSYKLEVYDKEGNGINSGNGEGYFTLTDANDDLIIDDDGKFGAQANYYIWVKGEDVKVEDIAGAELSVYPNPADDILIVNTEATVSRIDIFNLHGQLVKTIANNDRILVDDLAPGIYMLKVGTPNGNINLKFIKR